MIKSNTMKYIIKKTLSDNEWSRLTLLKRRYDKYIGDNIMLQMRCNFSLVTRCKITRHSLQNLLVTPCRSCSLQKTTRYSLQNPLVTRCRSCLLQKTTHYLLQNSLVTRCRSCSLQRITRYSLQNPLVTCFSLDC